MTVGRTVGRRGRIGVAGSAGVGNGRVGSSVSRAGCVGWKTGYGMGSRSSGVGRLRRWRKSDGEELGDVRHGRRRGRGGVSIAVSAVGRGRSSGGKVLFTELDAMHDALSE
jgi:hypothetical protein